MGASPSSWPLSFNSLQAGDMHSAPAQSGVGCAPGEPVSQLCRLLLLPLPLCLTNESC